MRIRIELEAGETQEQADEILEKALKTKEEAALAHGKFEDPEIEKLAQKMISDMEKLQKKILSEIEEALKP